MHYDVIKYWLKCTYCNAITVLGVILQYLLQVLLVLDNFLNERL